MTQTLVSPSPQSLPVLRYAQKILKRIIPLALLGYFLPRVLAVYAVLGMLDVLRNSPCSLSTMQNYFFGKGVLTWLLSPINLLMDLLCLPYLNRGVFELDDLPKRYQAEIQALIDATHTRNLIPALEEKMGEKKRGMIFFQWYGRVLQTSVEVPEFRKRYKYIRTIGVSIFNKRQSTDKHFGPLRVTYRVLYNINDIDDPNVFIRVGDHLHRWRDGKLFIFDDTQEHESHNDSDALRYCLFVDMLRPSLLPWVLSSMVTGVRLLMAPGRAIFYKHWTFFK